MCVKTLYFFLEKTAKIASALGTPQPSPIPINFQWLWALPIAQSLLCCCTPTIANFLSA